MLYLLITHTTPLYTNFLRRIRLRYSIHVIFKDWNEAIPSLHTTLYVDYCSVTSIHICLHHICVTFILNTLVFQIQIDRNYAYDNIVAKISDCSNVTSRVELHYTIAHMSSLTLVLHLTFLCTKKKKEKSIFVHISSS